MKKKLLMIVLAAMMVMIMLPSAVFAEENVCKIVGGSEYSTIQAAIGAANAGDTIELLKNVELDGSTNGFININKSITLDGKGYKISGYGFRGSNMTSIEINQLDPTNNIEVTIKNVAIENNESGGRPIETRASSDAMIKSLTLDNVSIIAENGATQGITIGNWHDAKLELNLKDTSIKAFYDIIVFNPADITIDNSTLDGWTCAHFREENSSAGSYGSSITVKNGSILTGTSKQDGVDNNFATIVAEGDISVNIIDSTVIAKAEKSSLQYAIRIDDQMDTSIEADSTVIVDGDSSLQAEGNNTALVYFADYGTSTKDAWDIQFKDGKFSGPLYYEGGTGTKLPLSQFKISGGVYTDEAAIYNSADNTFGISNNVIEGYSVISNKDSDTKTTYPWTIGHIVNFKVGDEVKHTFEVKHGGYITDASVETPSVSGKTFAGWFDENNNQYISQTFSEKIEKNTTYTAVFRDASSTDGKIEVKETDKEIKATSNIEKKDIPISSGELTKMDGGETLKVNLIIEKVEEPKTETKDADKSLVEKTVKDNNLTLGTYLDVSLVKQLYTAEGEEDGDEVKIEETLSPITVTLTVPENLRAEGRTYTVIRVHNGVSDILFSGKADKNWQITFTTDKFSTYAIAYSDDGTVVDETTTDTDKTTTDADKTTKSGESADTETGDGNNLMMYFVILDLVMLAIVAWLAIKVKSQRK